MYSPFVVSRGYQETHSCTSPKVNVIASFKQCIVTQSEFEEYLQFIWQAIMLIMNIISSPMARAVSLLDRSLVSEQPACTCSSKVSALVLR
jgi:hypothetical protein